MSKQSSAKVYKLLSFLKKNTDANHPATQAKLRELAGDEYASEIFGDKGTFSRRLKDLADALNTDSAGNVLSEEEWQLVYPGYQKNGGKNGKIYYKQPVTDLELEFLLKQVDASLDFTSAQKKSLKKRLTENLSSRYFSQGSFIANAIIQDLDLTNDDFSSLEEMLSTLRKHILEKHMLVLVVEDSVATTGKREIRFSPYQIYKKNSVLWLIGNWHDRPQKEHPWPQYTDALTAIDISKIQSAVTAHTPDATYIHWTSTNALQPGQSYTRYSTEKRISKARYPEYIQQNLERLHQVLSDLQFEHMKDIDLVRKKL